MYTIKGVGRNFGYWINQRGYWGPRSERGRWYLEDLPRALPHECLMGECFEGTKDLWYYSVDRGDLSPAEARAIREAK